MLVPAPNTPRQDTAGTAAAATQRADPQSTYMFKEAAEAPEMVGKQIIANCDGAERIGAMLRRLAPRAVVTCARGSSDHAATYAKYLIETRTGVLTASAAPSVSSVYGVQPDLHGCLFIAISQSGRSPDLVASAEAAKVAGATVLALVNAEGAPLAAVADHVMPLLAGPERSVAATKSYIASLAALAQVVAAWTDDRTLRDALDAAPAALQRAWDLDWTAAIPLLQGASNLYVIGRGIGLGIAQEAALKCKETCRLHAEAFSGAEVRHGPQALLQTSFPALILSQNDETRADLNTLAAELVAREVRVLAAGGEVAGTIPLPTVPAHPAIEPLLMVQSFYRLANALSIARGCDPDRPPHLRKITETR